MKLDILRKWRVEGGEESQPRSVFFWFLITISSRMTQVIILVNHPGCSRQCLTPLQTAVGAAARWRVVFLLFSPGFPTIPLQERNTSPAFEWSSCDAGLGLVWRCYWIYMSFVCLIQKKIFILDFWRAEAVKNPKKGQCKKKIHYELIRSINNPSWFIQMQDWCSSSG